MLNILFVTDVPMGEKERNKDRDGAGSRSPSRRAAGLTDRDSERDGENWLDDDRDGEGRRRDADGDRLHGNTVNARFEDKDITDLKMVCIFIAC